MKLCAVVCEYNPFHNGHAYHLQKAARAANADAILCIMSGNFVQRAEPAVVNKYLRAECALLGGADIVLELPTVFAVANGQQFAEGALSVLKSIPNVSYLAMGCEDPKETALQRIADIQAEESDAFKTILKDALQEGCSYASAYTKATVQIAEKLYSMGTLCDIILKKPNNLLAIEYLKSIKKLQADIKPILIRRQGNGYNTATVGGDYISATAARALLQAKDFTPLEAYIPPNCLPKLRAEIMAHSVDIGLYEGLVLHALRTAPNSDLYDAAEGIEQKLIGNAQTYTNLTKVLEETKSKRYTMSRLRRLCLQALLGITKTLMRTSSAAPTRLLGIRNEVRGMLGDLPPSVLIQNTDMNHLEPPQTAFLEIDKKASMLYSLITRKDGNSFTGNRLLTV